MSHPDLHEGFNRAYIESRQQQGYSGPWLVMAHGNKEWCVLSDNEFIKCDLYTKHESGHFCFANEVDAFRGAHGMDY